MELLTVRTPQRQARGADGQVLQPARLSAGQDRFSKQQKCVKAGTEPFNGVPFDPERKRAPADLCKKTRADPGHLSKV